jgi:hypothetical protein
MAIDAGPPLSLQLSLVLPSRHKCQTGRAEHHKIQRDVSWKTEQRRTPNNSKKVNVVKSRERNWESPGRQRVCQELLNLRGNKQREFGYVLVTVVIAQRPHHKLCGGIRVRCGGRGRQPWNNVGFGCLESRIGCKIKASINSDFIPLLVG